MRSCALITRVILVLCHVIGIRSTRDITIDDDSPLVRYEGTWGRSNRNAFSFGGTHASSTDPATAKATFTFTGIAVHFLAPLWFIPIAVTLTLDQRPPDVVDLQTPGTPQGNIWEAETSGRRWSMTGLDNVAHTLVVTYGRPQNTTRPPAQFTVVDGFTYTVEDETTSVNPPPTSSSNPPPTLAAPPTTSSRSSSNNRQSTTSSPSLTSSNNSPSSPTSSTSSGSPSQTSDDVGSESVDNSPDTSENGGGSNSSSSLTPLIAGLVSALVSTSLIAGLALFILWRRKQKRNVLLGVPPMAASVTRDSGSPGAPSAFDPYQYPEARSIQTAYGPGNSMSEVGGVSNAPVISPSGSKRVVMSPPTSQAGSSYDAMESTAGPSLAPFPANPFDDNGQAPPAYSG